MRKERERGGEAESEGESRRETEGESENSSIVAILQGVLISAAAAQQRM